MTLKAIIFDVDGTLADTEREGHLPVYTFGQNFAGAVLVARSLEYFDLDRLATLCLLHE